MFVVRPVWGNHTEINRPHLVGDEWINLACLQHPQHLDLRRRQHALDFVGEQSAASGMFDVPDPPLLGAPVKAPASWPNSSLSITLSGVFTAWPSLSQNRTRT